MTLGEVKQQIEEYSKVLKEEFGWTQEEIDKFDIIICLEGKETGIGSTVHQVEMDPYRFYLTGHSDYVE